MIYLKSLKSYLLRFLVMLALLAFILLFYLFTMLAFYKFKGESAILFMALRNYGFFLLYSIPFLVILTSCFYFAFLGAEKKFTMVMVPVISAVNAVILTVFFLVNADFRMLEKPLQMYYYPNFSQGTINSVKDYKIYADKINKGSVDRGVLFYRNAYLIGGGSVGRESVNISTYQAVGDNGITGDRRGFNISRKEPVVQIQETGISRFLFRHYIGYIKHLRTVFTNTFVTKGSAGFLFSALAIFLMGVGFFGIISGVVVYFNERQIMALSYAALVAVSVLLLMGFPYFLSLIALIKFGIRNSFFKVVLPSLFVGGLTAMIGYGLLELRQAILRRSGR